MANPRFSQSKAVAELVRRYNKGDLEYLPEKQKEQIAMLAAQMGLNFNVKSKPIRKGLFDLVDTALLGLVPNSLRPYSVGEEYFGESQSDKFSGTLGMLAGSVVPGALAVKGMGKLRNWWNTPKPKSGPIGFDPLYKSPNTMAQLNPVRDNLIGGRQPNLLDMTGNQLLF
tara:strand:+ start:225 stop:734 length:510 start_codon:yes stop_codon:yes gene_type:complete